MKFTKPNKVIKILKEDGTYAVIYPIYNNKGEKESEESFLERVYQKTIKEIGLSGRPKEVVEYDKFVADREAEKEIVKEVK